MNKFIFALAAVALVGAVSAGPVVEEQMTQLAVFPDDDQEIAGLAAEKQIFRDFCFTARDEVEKYIKDGPEYVSRVYKIVSDSFSKAEGFNAINAGFELMAKLQAMGVEIRKNMSMVDVVKSSCGNINYDIRPKIEAIFGKAKETALASGADEKIVKSTRLDNLGCATMKRLVWASNSCDFLTRLAPTIMQ